MRAANCSSKRDVLRGLHCQVRKPQGKLVRVVCGEVFNVAVGIHAPEHDRCIRWDDPEPGIARALWGEPSVSAKDQDGGPLRKAEMFPRGLRAYSVL